MKISLPATNTELWKYSHEFAWLFRKKFGFFPDRDGAFMQATTDNWEMITEKELTKEQIQEIKEFCKDEKNFGVLNYSNLLILDIDFSNIEDKLSKFLNEKDFLYVGKGHEQHIYFFRELTPQEKQKVKDVLLAHITIY